MGRAYLVYIVLWLNTVEMVKYSGSLREQEKLWKQIKLKMNVSSPILSSTKFLRMILIIIENKKKCFLNIL